MQMLRRNDKMNQRARREAQLLAEQARREVHEALLRSAKRMNVGQMVSVAAQFGWLSPQRAPMSRIA